MARDPRIERGMLAQLTERAQRLEDGEASLGWKLGMGVPAAMKKLGTDAPLVGYLLAGARVDDGGTVSLDGWGNAKLEPEIAVHMGADLAPRRLARGRRGGDRRAGRRDRARRPRPRRRRPRGDPRGRHLPAPRAARPARRGRDRRRRLRARARRTATRRRPPPTPPRRPATPSTSCCTSRPSSATAGETLRAGEVVICGSVVPALDVAPGDTVEVQLDPLGTLTVSFA